MGRYLDPKNDLPFKRIFGDHPDILINFLNALMPFTSEEEYITSIEYLSPEQVPDNPAKKNSIVDVRCKDNRGRQYIVEMQMYWNTLFSNRLVFNASKAYVRQLDKNEEYNLLQPVYALGILNDIFDRETDDYYHHYKIVNCKNTNDVIKGLEFVMIELPKFKAETFLEKKMTVLWLRFLKEIEGDKYIEPAPELMENEYVRKAIDLCEQGAFTDKELEAYEKYWDLIRVEKSLLYGGREEGLKEGLEKGRQEGKEEGLSEGLEKGRQEGKEEGLSEGLEKGRQEGLEKGLEKGRQEGLEKGLETFVINSFKNGLSVEIISTVTGKSTDEVISVLKKNNLL